MYVIGAWLLWRIGKMLGYSTSWYAWVPLLNIYMMADLSYRDTVTWFLLALLLSFFCSFIGMVIMVMLWMDIADRCGYNELWGVLFIIPIANFVMMYMPGSSGGVIVAPSTGPGGADHYNYQGLPPIQHSASIQTPSDYQAPSEWPPRQQAPCEWPPRGQPMPGYQAPGEWPPRQPPQPQPPQYPPGQPPKQPPNKWV